MKYITGIGSRIISPEYKKIIFGIAKKFVDLEYTLRSGAAKGSDTYWEEAFDNLGGKKEIFLPWKEFRNNSSELFKPPPEAYVIAKKYHPCWNKLTKQARHLMARNVQQIFGQELLIKTDLVICYTDDGCESYKTRSKVTGGTGMAIELASRFGIPVINLKNDNYEERIEQLFIIEY